LNNLKRLVDYIITLASGINLSVANVTTAVVVATTVGGVTYYNSKKSNEIKEESSIDQSSQDVSAKSQAAKKKRQRQNNYSNLLAKDKSLAQKKLNSPNNNLANDYYPSESPRQDNQPPVDSGLSQESSLSEYSGGSSSGSISGGDTSETSGGMVSSSSSESEKSDGQSGAGRGSASASESSTEGGSGSSKRIEKPVYFSSTPTAELVAGICGEINFSYINSAKENVETENSETIYFKHSSSGKFYVDDQCLTEVTKGIETEKSAKAFKVYYKNTKAESVAVNVYTSRGFVPALDISFTVIPDAVTSLTLEGAAEFKSGSCSGPYQVKQFDQFLNLATANQELNFNISGFGSASIYADAACTSNSTIFSTNADDEGFSFYVKDDKAESLTLNVDDSADIQAANLAVVVGPSKLALTVSDPIRSGDCSAVVVETKDELGNIASVLGSYNFSLSDSSLWKFYPEGDSTCSQGEITSISFVKGNSSKTIYYKPVGSGTTVLTALDSSGYMQTATATTHISPRSLVWENDPLTSADYCLLVKIKSQDSLSVSANVLKNETINLTTSSGTANYYAAADTFCVGAIITNITFPTGQAEVSLRVKDQNAETITLTATDNASVILPGSNSLIVGPNNLAISGASPVRAGDCNQYTLFPKDALGNATTATQNYTLNISDLTASGQFYADADTTCSGATISSLNLLNGSSGVNFRYKNDKAETVSLNADDVSATLTSAIKAVIVGPRNLEITGASQILSGNCYPYLMKFKDVLGNYANTAVTHTLNLSDSKPEGGFFSDASCTISKSSYTSAVGVGSVTFYYKNTKQQSSVVSVVEATSLLTTTNIAIDVGPYKITAAGNAETRAGDCELITLTTKDFLNTTGAVQADTAVTLDDGVGSGSFYAAADTLCSGATQNSVNILSATSTISFRYKNNKSEAVTIVSSDGAGGLLDSNFSLNVGPKDITLSSSTPILSGACTSVVITTKDVNATTAAVIRATTVNLDDDAAVGSFYSDVGCLTSITSTSLAIGASTKTVYYKNNKAELITLSATDNAAWLTTGTYNTQTGPSQFVITGTTPVKAGTCNQYTVTTKDAAGNVAGVLAAKTVNLTKGTSTTAAFYAAADTTCSGAAITSLSFATNDTTKSFYMKDNKAETFTITASDGALANGTLSVTVGPDRLGLTTAASLRSGDCILVTITTKDAQPAAASVLSSTTINLTDDSATGEFYSSATCATVVTSATIASGSTGTFYYKDDIKENVVITATDNAGALTSTTLNMSIGPRSYNITGTSPVKAGTCNQYTVTTKDAAGNVAGVLSAKTVTLTKGTSTTATFYAAADTTCSGAAITTLSFAINDSVKTFYMKDNKAETFTITASDAALVNGTLSVAVSPDRLALTDTPPHYSGSCDLITITTKDAQPATASVLSSTTINLTDDTATGEFYSNAGCTTVITSATIASGSSTTFYYKDTIKEAVVITATDNAGWLSSTTLNLNIGPAYFELTGTTPVRASDCTLYTINSKDSSGNLSGVLSATTVNLTKGASTTAVFYSAADTTCVGAAITSVSFAINDSSKTFRMKNQKAETFTMTADDVGGMTAGTLSVVVGPSKLTFNGRAGISWNYCRQYNIRARDELNNITGLLAATTLDLTETGSGLFYDNADTTCVGAPITTIAMGVGTSAVQVRYMDAVKELVTLTATDQAAYLAAGSINVEVGAEKLVISGTSPVKSGECTLYTVESRDADDVPQNVLQNTTITIDDQTGLGLMYADTDATCSGAAITSVSMTTGTSQKQFRYKNNTAQTVSLKADDGAGGRDIGYLTVVVGPDRLDITGGDKISINGCVPYTITGKDTATNTANLIYDSTFDLLDGAASGDFYDTGDTTCSGATIAQKTILTGANNAVVYYKNPVSEFVTLTVTDQATYLSGDTLNAEVGADRLSISGANYLRADECGLYTLSTLNNLSAAQNVLADSTITLSDATAAGAFYAAADATCSGAAITTVTVLNGTSSVDYRYKNPKAEAFVMSADDGAAGRTAASLAMTIGPNKLAISGTASINSGQCVSYTINSKDAQNTNANVNALTTIDLNDVASAGEFYAAADTTCSGATVTQVTMAAASNSTTFRYKNSTAEAVVLNTLDNASYLLPASYNVTVGPGKLILTGSTPIRSGDCSMFTVTAKDINDVATNVGVTTTINLAKGGSLGSFYGSADSTCAGAAVTSVQIAAGNNNVNFYFKDAKAESTVMTITDATTSMLQDSRTIVTTERDIILSGSTTITSGVCQSYTASIKDAAGNLVNVTSDLVVSLTDGAAQGEFYAAADSSCSGAILTSVSVLTGSSSIGFRYKNLTSEGLTLTADDGVSGLNAGTLSLTVGPSQLVITGTTPQAASACEIFTVTSKDAAGNAANAIANINVNFSDGAGVGAFYAAADTTCSGAAITSTTILNASNSINVRYKNDTIEVVTLNADDQAGVLTSGTLLLSIEAAGCMGGFKVEPVVAGTPTFSFISGATFDVKVTAIDGGGATRTCFTGNKSISWSMQGATATNFDCGEGSGVPVPPSETTLNFVDGVATTTSNVAKFKVAETATIEATVGSSSGVSNNIIIGLGSICQIKLRDAASGAGSIISSKTIDLNSNNSTGNSTATLYAAGMDAFGNYVQDVSVVWSGTGVVTPWEQTTTVSLDTAKVIGVKVGSGVLQADYAGGGAGKTATVNFTVTSTNSSTTWLSSTTDNGLNGILDSNQVLKSVYWSPKNDTSNTWLTTGAQSWRSESFLTNIRGARASFPEKGFIVGTNSGLDIIDSTTNTLWMRFSSAANKAIDANFGTINSLAAINGKILVGMQLNSTTGTVIILDFENDTIKRIDANGLYTFSANIAARNSLGTWTLADAGKKLVQSAVEDLKVKRVSSYDAFAVATHGGANILQFSGASLSVSSLATTNIVSSVALDTNGKLYLAELNTGVHRADLSFPVGGTFSSSRTYINSAGVYMPTTQVNELEVAQGVSSAQAGSNTIFLGTNLGLVVLNEHSTLSSSTSKVYTAIGSGLTGFSGALLLNGVDSYGTLASAAPAIGPAQGHATTIEFWFAPSANISSGNYTLFEKGSGNSSVNISLASGKVNLTYKDSTGVNQSVQSTTSSWNKGEWHHVAAVISASGLELWIDGVDKQSLAVDLSSETLASQTAYIGANSSAAQMFTGMIDELRISNIARYSTATFAVSASEFVNDVNTLSLHHFNGRSGTEIPYADGVFQTNLTLVGGASWVIPKLIGYDQNVTALDVKTFSTNATCSVITGPTNGAWTELLNSQDNGLISVSRSQSVNQLTDILYYHEDSASDLDVGLSSSSNGLTLIRN
jgi:hypothetical protein